MCALKAIVYQRAHTWVRPYNVKVSVIFLKLFTVFSTDFFNSDCAKTKMLFYI